MLVRPAKLHKDRKRHAGRAKPHHHAPTSIPVATDLDQPIGRRFRVQKHRGLQSLAVFRFASCLQRWSIWPTKSLPARRRCGFANGIPERASLSMATKWRTSAVARMPCARLAARPVAGLLSSNRQVNGPRSTGTTCPSRGYIAGVGAGRSSLSPRNPLRNQFQRRSITRGSRDAPDSTT